MSLKPSVPGITIGEKIGHGAAGSVWSGSDDSGRARAVKICHPRNAALDLHGGWQPLTGSSEEERKGAFTEALRLAGVKHSHVVRIHAVHDLADSHGIALVMDRIPWTLWEVVMRQGPLRGANVVSLVRDISQGVAAMSESGVNHGDITPDNIGITDTGQVVLLDMGSPFGTDDKSEGHYNDLQAVARCALFALTGSVDDHRASNTDKPVSQALTEVLVQAAQRIPHFSPEDFRLNQSQQLNLEELVVQLQAIVPSSPIEIDRDALETRWDAPLTQVRNDFESERSSVEEGEETLFTVVRNMRHEIADDAEEAGETSRASRVRRRKAGTNGRKLRTKILVAAAVTVSVTIALGVGIFQGFKGPQKGGPHISSPTSSDEKVTSQGREPNSVKSPAGESFAGKSAPERDDQVGQSLSQWQAIVDGLSQKRQIAIENMDREELANVNAPSSRAEKLDLELVDQMQEQGIEFPNSTWQNLVKGKVFEDEASAALIIWTRELPNEKLDEEESSNNPEPGFVPVAMELRKHDDKWLISEVKETRVAIAKR